MSSRRSRARRATLVGIAGNAILFTVKAIAGAISGSIALVSDALNSLVDIASSIAIFYSVEVAHREPDEDHPYGHHRAEPIAAMGVAIFTAILGFEIGRRAILRLITGPQPIRVPGWAIAALGFSMVGNLLLAWYLRRRGRALESPAILANSVECENDIWTSFAALAGVIGAALGWRFVDPVAGFVVGLWIAIGGFRFGRQNIDYLMGKSPATELLEGIRTTCLGVEGVGGVHDIRAHYVGHRIHVEVHVEVDQELTTRRSHDVAGTVRHAIEEFSGVDRAFIHVDPVLDSTYVIETLGRCQRLTSVLYAEFARQHADRPALAGLWTALATAAQTRAERLTVAQRLKGAGWHFCDGDIDRARARESLERVEELEDRATKTVFAVADAVRTAVELEGDPIRSDVRLAARPQDATLVDSLEASTPPPPATDVLVGLVRGVLASGGEDRDVEQGLGTLAEVLAGGVAEEAPSG